MKIFKTIISLFTNNWWLKLIALLLAVAIYHGTRTEQLDNTKHTTHDRPIIQLP